MEIAQNRLINKKEKAEYDNESQVKLRYNKDPIINFVETIDVRKKGQGWCHAWPGPDGSSRNQRCQTASTRPLLGQPNGMAKICSIIMTLYIE